MNERLAKFVSESTQGTDYSIPVSWVIQRIETKGKSSMEDTVNMTVEELIELLINLKPSNKKQISVFVTIMGLYAKYLKNDAAYERLQTIDKMAVWQKYKSTHEIAQKFLSHSEFNDLLFNIQMQEEYNSEYYVALLQSIYEGIYSDDLSVLKNLRASDIKDDIVIIKDDTSEPFELRISNELAVRLQEIASVNNWYRPNRNGVCKISIEGLYEDSCFKNENRHNTPDGNYRNSYYTRIRKIAQDYLEFPLKAKNLYLSGIMWRIKKELKANGMSLEQTFKFNRKYGEDVKIVKQELQRIHYPYQYKDFTKLVAGYLDDFKDK